MSRQPIKRNVCQEEYGLIRVCVPFVSPKSSEALKKRRLFCRIVGIKHLLRSFDLTTVPRYRAESNGAMIFLEAVKIV